ncbi:hypothetical protein [Hydrogenophaga sp.]|uniref:hypothetical protein n=1 Tax=Hydrogenophaga sp. TaxID=1904254 RepID=UPI0027182C6B|nr:hypothetical protein [Hydrogenophaga sp.]MDO9504061.1 hypothetical protein [Hydrogenophaga sp.]
MLRSKWLQFGCRAEFKNFVADLQKRQFDSESGRGFELVSRGASHLKAKFIERISTIETVTDPYGVISELQTVRYNKTNFYLHICPTSNFKYILEINSPPRSVRPLVEALESLCNGVTVGELDLQLLDVYKKLSFESRSIRIARIKVSKLRLTPDSEAKVDFVSLRDAYADFIRAFGEIAVEFEKLKFDRPFGNKPHCMEINRNGLVSVDEYFEEQVREFLLGYLAVDYQQLRS